MVRQPTCRPLSGARSIPPAIDIWAPRSRSVSATRCGFCVIIGEGAERILASMEAEPFGQESPEAGLIDQIEGHLFPGKEAQRQLSRGGDHLGGLLQRQRRLADRAHREVDHEPKLPYLPVLFLKLLRGRHGLSFLIRYRDDSRASARFQESFERADETICPSAVIAQSWVGSWSVRGLSERSLQHRCSPKGSPGPEGNGDHHNPRVPQHTEGVHLRLRGYHQFQFRLDRCVRGGLPCGCLPREQAGPKGG